MRWLGVDPGRVRVGLAYCEDEPRIALPVAALSVRGLEHAAAAVAQVAAERQADELVVGLPLRLDGSEGEAARRARRFAERVGEIAERPVILWDERFTTRVAQRGLEAVGVRGRQQRAAVDSAAAAILLQSYLDATWASDSQRGQAEGDDAAGGPTDPDGG